MFQAPNECNIGMTIDGLIKGDPPSYIENLLDNGGQTTCHINVVSQTKIALLHAELTTCPARLILDVTITGW
jgi:hypothetical protein